MADDAPRRKWQQLIWSGDETGRFAGPLCAMSEAHPISRNLRRTGACGACNATAGLNVDIIESYESSLY
jgi:hypothetical protein